MTESQTKICQNCKNQFVIEPEDFAFYERMRVPPPTFCPDCRTARRMCYRNERALYKRACRAPGHHEEMISIYAPEKPFNVVDQKFWWSDEWDPLTYGTPYDFSKPFFQQFRELLERVPLLSVSNSNAVNSEYCNVADQSKDSYFLLCRIRSSGRTIPTVSIPRRICLRLQELHGLCGVRELAE